LSELFFIAVGVGDAWVCKDGFYFRFPGEVVRAIAQYRLPGRDEVGKLSARLDYLIRPMGKEDAQIDHLKETHASN
jgi:hypothetical protein